MKYAGLPIPLKIDLKIEYDIDNNLIFHVINGVAENLVKSGLARKLEGIRKQIKDGNYREKLSREGGGTGLKRIAAVVANLGGSLDFKLSGSMFELKAEFAIKSFSPEVTC